MTERTEVAVDRELEWRLHDQRQFLVRSLEDAAREHDAGDLDDGNYDALRRRDEQRLADVEEALDALATVPAVAEEEEAKDTPAPATTSARRRRRRRVWLAAGGVACLAAGAAVLVVQLTSPRLPGETATGSIDLNTAQQIERQLTQAETLVKEGKSAQALQLYGQVLTEDPKDPVALAEWGWLDWQAATTARRTTVAAEGASAVVEAVKLDKQLFVAQYYLGSILLQEGDAAKAVPHFAQFLADHPTAGWVADAAPTIRSAYADAGQTVPAGVPAASSTP